MELLCSRVLVLTSYAMTYTLCSPATWDTKQQHHQQQQQQQHQRMSPSDWGLRHGLPEDLPVPDLIETPNKLFDPRGRDLNATLLLQKLGRHYDHHFMSITNPRNHLHLHHHQHHNHHSNAVNATTSMTEFPFRRNGKGRLIPVGEMPEHLRKMNYRFIRLPDGSRLRTRISAKLKKKLQQFLWAYTSCPVVYRWRDLGVRFWPRYLKEGSCPPGKTSCSIPPGMQCRPAAKGHKTVLRFNCRTPHRNFLYASAAAVSVAHADVSINTPAPVCKWIEVKYPVVTKCACGCASIN